MNKLHGLSTYLIGPIDHVGDGGAEWRDYITPILEEMGVYVFNPLNKPIKGHLEDQLTRQKRREAQAKGDFETVYAERFTRSVDLRMVDKSDFLVVNFKPEDRPFGTVEEITLANRQKKPILVVTPGGAYQCSPWLIWQIGYKTIFENFDQAITYLRGINDGTVDGGKRWVFFDFGK